MFITSNITSGEHGLIDITTRYPMSKTNEGTIEPCIKCKDKSNVVADTSDCEGFPKGYFVACLNCRTLIIKDTEAEAIAAWNTMQREEGKE
jgi:hypothetical protein